MADDDNSVSFKLDLDASGFAEGGQQALDLLNQIGETDSISGLLSGFADLGIAVGAAGLAVFAFKEALDLTMEGEEIQRIEAQFQQLAAGAGVSGEALKEGLEQASGGLIDTTTLLQSASKGIVQMGANSMQLVQIMTLARQATQVFGGDLVTNFDNITRAISTGNTHMLKRYGIVIDNATAEKTYAASLGITADELSATGKQHALMNAALAAASKEFANVQVAVATTTNVFQQFKTSLTEIKDFFVVEFSKTIGTGIHTIMQDLADMARKGKDALYSTFGVKDQAITAQIDSLTLKAEQLNRSIASLKAHEGLMAKILPNSFTNAAIDKANEELKQTEAQITALKATQAAAAQEDLKSTAQVAAAHKAANQSQDIDQKKVAEDQLKFQKQLLTLDEATTKAQEKNITSVDQIDKIIADQKVARAKATADAIKKIQQDAALSQTQKDQLIAAEERKSSAEEIAAQKQEFATRQQLMTNYQQNATSVFQGIAAAAQKTSIQATHDLADFGKQGQLVVSTFESQSTSAFEGFGQAIAAQQNVAQSATKAIKSLFLGMIGDICEAEGKQVLASSVFPPSPAGIAAGGALIALGAAIKSAAGGTASSSTGSLPSVSTGSSGSGPTTALSPTTGTSSSLTGTSTTDQSQISAQAQVQRSVTVNIAGNYLNTAESQRTIMQIMRNETDATGFSYNSIGV